MLLASAKRRKRPPSRWTASQTWPWIRSWAWSLPAPPTPIWFQRWRHAWHGSKTKTHFVIVDAVGVCEEEKAPTKPLDRKPNVALDKIMGLVAAGAADADLVSTLAARLARLQDQDALRHRGCCWRLRRGESAHQAAGPQAKRGLG